jgi:uncharacterized protein (TIRG00374 family)
MMKREESLWYKITHARRLSEKEYMKMIHRVMLFIVVGFLVSFAVFMVLAVIGGIGNVGHIIFSSNLYIYSLAFVCVLGAYLLCFVKWNYYLKKLDIRLPLRKNMVVYFSMYAMELTPGRVGRVLVAYTLNRLTKKKLANTVPIVTIDIFTDFLGIAILAFVAAVYFHQYILYILIIDIVLVLPYAFILSSWFYNLVKRLLRKGMFLRLFTLFGDEYFASQSKLNTPSTYAVSLATSVPSAFLNSMALYFSLIAIGIVPTLSNSVFIYSSANLIGMVTGIPGNIGITDGSLVAFLGGVLKISTTLGSAVTIMVRLATLWFGFAIGTALLFYSFRYWIPKKKAEKVRNPLR